MLSFKTSTKHKNKKTPHDNLPPFSKKLMFSSSIFTLEIVVLTRILSVTVSFNFDIIGPVVTYSTAYVFTNFPLPVKKGCLPRTNRARDVTFNRLLYHIISLWKFILGHINGWGRVINYYYKAWTHCMKNIFMLRKWSIHVLGNVPLNWVKRNLRHIKWNIQMGRRF